MLQQARALRRSGAGGSSSSRSSGGGGGGGGGSGTDGRSEAAWMEDAAATAQRAMVQVVRVGGAAALEELRAAATAGSFKEVLRVLGAVEEEAVQQPWRPAAAPTGAPAAAPTPLAAPERVPQAGAPAAEPAVADAPPRRKAGAGAARGACAACGAADAPLMCAGCRGARYCGLECQKRDWRAHKAACKQRRQ